MDDNVLNMDDSEYDTSDLELPSAGDIFSSSREHIGNENDDSSEADSSIESDDLSESFVHPDENTKILTCDHEYLGELEPIRGREIMDDESEHEIPMLPLTSPVMLVPGQILPLRELEERAVNVLKYALDGNHIFGIIPLYRSRNRNEIGTTAEIIAYAQINSGYIIKAIGRQRFRKLSDTSRLINDRYVHCARIKILPEVTLPPVLHGIQLPSLNKFRLNNRNGCLKREACQIRWPFWLYRFHDEKFLVEEVKRKLKKNFHISENIKYCDDPSLLPFQVLKSIPVTQKVILEALKLNCAIQRLHCILKILSPKIKTTKLICVSCRSTIAKSSSIFAMSAEGPQGTYVNPGGYVHELITVKKVKNVFTSGYPEKNYSWFPGYEWSVFACSVCKRHLGWKFNAYKDLRPQNSGQSCMTH